MNLTLQKMFSLAYTPEHQATEDRAGSSLEWTQKLRNELPGLYKKYNINSMFDAGCNDCSWSSRLESSIEYHGGDISLPMIASVWKNYPKLDVILHDITTDPLPAVDVLFVRDVAIHLNNQDKTALLKNWLHSTIPWLLITQDDYERDNPNVDYDKINFPVACVNWTKAPWNFPDPTDQIWETNGYEYGRRLALWHRNQIKGLI